MWAIYFDFNWLIIFDEIVLFLISGFAFDVTVVGHRSDVWKKFIYILSLNLAII